MMLFLLQMLLTLQEIIEYTNLKAYHTVLLTGRSSYPLLHHPLQAYTIRRDTFRNYCKDLLSNNARARSSYLAVASLSQAFPQLKDELPINDYIKSNGKIHLGPYMWVALKGHYEFCHYDPGNYS